jgi:hypothetical protein
LRDNGKIKLSVSCLDLYFLLEWSNIHFSDCDFDEDNYEIDLVVESVTMVLVRLLMVTSVRLMIIISLMIVLDANCGL